MKPSTLVTISILASVVFVHNVRGIDWNGNNRASGCDFPGKHLFNVQIRSEDCAERCTHFTWNSTNGGTCWMKKGSIFTDDAITANDQSMICGVIDDGTASKDSVAKRGINKRWTYKGKTRKIGPGKDVKNTFQLQEAAQDIGIAASLVVSWPGKVSGRKTYVKSCSKNGYSAHNNPNVVSSCEGGGAFPCNNQQPWAINDKLAYGFAARSAKYEKGICCKCYKLVFTSGPVKGKTMIVQVTNSGGDVNRNQFDLQIPGGGVGAYTKGCHSQWNSPDDGWGKRYGGVGSRKECNALPSPIRAGCFFRFDWFKGADNPTMIYSKVRCPKQLVAITKCYR